ncbi:MAG: hypothetical protein CSA66_00725 [Proteobacteria bacterium]|nr:MAG: hypothetical protein CSA66_00725 [Pseudomonadota bacterium]
MQVTALTTALALAGALGSCASSGPVEPDLGPDGVIVTRQQLASLEGLADQVEALRAQIGAVKADNAALRQRVGELEVRAGLRPFRPKTLARMTGRMVMPDALRVDRVGARGRRASLGRHLAGSKGLVMAYWATWCVPCVADDELTQLRELRRQLKPHGVELVTMAIDDLAAVQRHRKSGQWLYPLWQRSQGHFAMLPESFVKSHGVNLPLFVVVSPSGEAQWYREGALTHEAVSDLVNAALRASTR